MQERAITEYNAGFAVISPEPASVRHARRHRVLAKTMPVVNAEPFRECGQADAVLESCSTATELNSPRTAVGCFADDVKRSLVYQGSVH